MQIGIAIIISFICYIPVVLFASTTPAIGMLMIPKTCAYLWIIWTDFKELNYSPIQYEELKI